MMIRNMLQGSFETCPVQSTCKLPFRSSKVVKGLWELALKQNTEYAPDSALPAAAQNRGINIADTLVIQERPADGSYV